MFPEGGGVQPVIPGFNPQGRVAPMGFMRPPRHMRVSPPGMGPAAGGHSWGSGNVLSLGEEEPQGEGREGGQLEQDTEQESAEPPPPEGGGVEPEPVLMEDEGVVGMLN